MIIAEQWAVPAEVRNRRRSRPEREEKKAPALSRLQSHPERYRRTFLYAFEAMALVAFPVVEEELVLVTAPWIRSLARLRGRGAAVKLIVFRAGCTYRALLEALLAARGVVGTRRLEFGTLDGIVGCVAAGIGVTLLPRAVVARAQREGRVALHTLPRDEARVPTVLVRRRDAFTSAALARFIALAQEVLPVARTRSPRRSRHASRGGRGAGVARIASDGYDARPTDGSRGAFGMRIHSTR